ncbi:MULTISPECIES: isopenicillin N synthase family dioxygenase [Sphingomonadaceae]|jgi:isopenicillin N synthase-like dioxygenase|uniref:2-oxoglutarate-dependent ethylene/succinate-forming enzyme n=1 Tax=Novosphingobium resinovorum TaxID=158500 RepID=A0A031K5N9_9SPHN|nr:MULTISPECIES: 2-oxoglutarate and iron-dependent oxygenase domain-containing protein [Sphingomonadaceae]AOR76600.1 flavonol synthase [Novosphingobium resinovorum]EJU09284.1 2OG-Fe(II) oxygenase [Sphingomonas sp. LH128]EZP83907.1 2OG-Fe(II) oxygenase [Novosphingobium resinovorum]GLK43090.1 oxidoreductase [Novosphingobium resinovorum]
MDLAQIPVLSLVADSADLPARIGESFRTFGFAMIRDHGIDQSLIDQAWARTEEFFALPVETKQKYFIPGQGGARGYTPFRTEVAKGAKEKDLKEFWHVGRDVPADSPLAASMPPNIWPTEVEGFEETFRELYAQFDEAGAKVLSAIAVDLGLDAGWFDAGIEDGNSVMRLLHYPPVSAESGGAIRAGAHEDINLITLLLGAQEAGLELLSKDGRWLSVAPPEGAIVVNIGDMLQRLTNHVLPSTTHRVRNPEGARAGHSRYSMPFFLHLRSDFRFVTLPECVSDENPDRYPVSITADDYLQERLREIGLKM